MSKPPSLQPHDSDETQKERTDGIPLKPKRMPDSREDRWSASSAMKRSRERWQTKVVSPHKSTLSQMPSNEQTQTRRLDMFKDRSTLQSPSSNVIAQSPVDSRWATSPPMKRSREALPSTVSSPLKIMLTQSGSLPEMQGRQPDILCNDRWSPSSPIKTPRLTIKVPPSPSDDRWSTSSPIKSANNVFPSYTKSQDRETWRRWSPPGPIEHDANSPILPNLTAVEDYAFRTSRTCAQLSPLTQRDRRLSHSFKERLLAGDYEQGKLNGVELPFREEESATKPTITIELELEKSLLTLMSMDSTDTGSESGSTIVSTEVHSADHKHMSFSSITENGERFDDIQISLRNDYPDNSPPEDKAPVPPRRDATSAPSRRWSTPLTFCVGNIHGHTTATDSFHQDASTYPPHLMEKPSFERQRSAPVILSPTRVFPCRRQSPFRTITRSLSH